MVDSSFHYKNTLNKEKELILEESNDISEIKSLKIFSIRISERPKFTTNLEN